MTSELIIALDVASSSRIAPVLAQMPGKVAWYKVGLELFCAEGPRALVEIRERKKNIFLDLKLHDIPRTVERAVRSASKHGAQMLTIHATGGRAMMQAAAAAADESGLTLLAVTALTSLDRKDLKSFGIWRNTETHVLKMAELALNAGVPGLVCSAQEVKKLRAVFGDKPILVTPGIRPSNDSAGDQKRIATPRDAVRDGSSFLVVGRPVLDAPDPHAAAEAILREMSDAHK